MRIRHDNSIESDDPSEKRSAGRLRCEGLRCSLGDVRDLSAGGVLVRRRRAPREGIDEPIVIWIEGVKNERVFLKARLRRSRRVGLRMHESAYEFIQLSDEKKLALVGIASTSVRHEFGLGGTRVRRPSSR